MKSFRSTILGYLLSACLLSVTGPLSAFAVVSDSDESPSRKATPPFNLNKRKAAPELPGRRRINYDQCEWRASDEFSGLKNILGQGEFGRVVATRHSDSDVILKILGDANLNVTQHEAKRQKTAAQVGVAPQVTMDPFCLVEGEKNNFAFGMENIPNALSLDRFLKKRGPEIQSKEDWTRLLDEVAVQAYRALDQLHQTEIAHNDICPANLLIVPSPHQPEKISKVLLIDFGIDDDDEGHPEYHAKESLSLSGADRDLVSLANVYLSLLGESYYETHRHEKPTLRSVYDAFSKKQGPFRDVIFPRLKKIILEQAE